MKEKFSLSTELQTVLLDIWKLLEKGAKSFNDPYHWPALGTNNEQGCNLRTVILREADPKSRSLICYSDLRAGKINEIQSHKEVVWLFYHPKKKIQLKIAGPATLHTDDKIAEEYWEKTSAVSRLNFCTIESPGTPIDSPSNGLPDLLLNKIPSLFNTQKGRQNFAAIICQIKSIDWLALSAKGNKRARFLWEDDSVQATWLVP